jgi:molecular chaperone DnaK (HSP70)
LRSFPVNMAISAPSRESYSGSTKRLIIAIDVGTTFSAASFCVLQPNKVPKFEEVLRWTQQVIALFALLRYSY